MGWSKSKFVLLGLLIVAFPLSSTAKSKKQLKASLSQSSFPDTFLSRVAKGERFKNPDYFSIVAGDGIRKADVRGLFQRISAAINDGENYKALYFARIFTDLKPDSPQGWANRASIAATLGLKEESAASQAHSEHPEGARPVPLGICPGEGLSVKPRDLYDWAAAIALVADGATAKFGPGQVISVRDDISGIHVSTQDELAALNADLARDGLPLTGPWALSEPLLLKDLLPNLFSLVSGTPMKEKITNTGSLVGAMALAGLAGLQQDANTAAQVSQAAGATMERANSVPSKYSGGSYLAAIFPAGTSEQKEYRPRPSGELHAVGGPLPLLWASGSSLSPTVFCQLISTGDLRTSHITPEDLRDASKKAKKKRIKEHLPPLNYPKLATLSFRGGESIPVTLFEVMLVAEDANAMFPDKRISLFDWSGYNEGYLGGGLILGTKNGNGLLIGYDDKGIAYVAGPRPTAWLMPVPRKN